ncbi:hypothetical protein FGO68_gene4327 [Halteria grandinella]|uniref:Uncharacterized protein n=1 Tax=Halteria grandinella TaxID=5974 RepID=A0A8J8NI47_HALGN|nr:hypothetical protein FGO68_gene4327 [Halteria grandinella]
MFLMPIEYIQEVGELAKQTVCVHDCAAADSAFVSNPINMRCEFLGNYCLNGNYTNGCITNETYLTQRISKSDLNASFPHYQWMKDLDEAYKISIINPNVLIPTKTSEYTHCLTANDTLGVCKVCEIGFYADKSGQCVCSCGSDQYGEIETTETEDQIQIISTKCQTCPVSCLTCISQDYCTSCQLGHMLVYSQSNIQVSCEPFSRSTHEFQNYILYVTGQREEGYDHGKFMFGDLLFALKHAYKLHLSYSNLKMVTILISEDIEHFITPSDFANSYPLIEEQSLLGGSYSLQIMQAITQIILFFQATGVQNIQ